jgi:hypothetical protein
VYHPSISLGRLSLGRLATQSFLPTKKEPKVLALSFFFRNFAADKQKTYGHEEDINDTGSRTNGTHHRLMLYDNQSGTG